MSRFGMIPYHRDSMVADLMNMFERPFLSGWPSENYFRTDIKDNGESLSLLAELPGIAKENLDIQVDGDVLTITVRQNEEKEEKSENYLRRERVSGSYRRSFDISGIDAGKITASYQDGILTLDLPKAGESGAKPHKIDVA